MRLQRDSDRFAYFVCILLALQYRCLVQAESFTYPTATEFQFIVGDLVNVSWDVLTSRVSLYEVCNTQVPLLLNVTNPYSYVWNATRDNYRESGCAFELDSLNMFGNLDPPVLTSVKFGVSKRQKDDPPPELYNFYDEVSSTSSSTTSSTSSATPATSTSSTTSATSTFTSSSHNTSTTVAETTAASSIPATTDNGGLTVAQKVGIGLGVPLVVLAISTVGALIFWYRRRSQRGSGLDENPDEPTSSGMVDAAKAPLDHRMSRAETVIAELPSPSFPMEGIEEVVNHRPISEIMGTPRNELGT
ncbi:hypothetical protein ASPBRDRAFT_208555 [Aspergillus brasiliensis CBS 101740]|uniref:Mid2 domain-containing protein n=1 Tax=Aspergillus brasiliensis (strain CBS 101740 / IMI 381727 / IBT 21946) TaxID=767769 RepID=A0A1L9UDW1_ASPBC|nr:hypothetical protein ASPBRDRAFT_208555 [Aspergillus brasiliensis CBS 101740]